MGLIIRKDSLYQKDGYDLSTDRNYASLFVVGNGYFNVRGSFEEESDAGTQGLFIRGYIDKSIEPVVPWYQSVFLKKYYFNDDNLKKWQDTECGINPFDPLPVFIFVDGVMFNMCDGNVTSYERELFYKTGEYVRTITWDNGNGDLTKITFKRFVSFKKKNLLAQKVLVEALNHNKEIKIIAGVETRVKTMGLILTNVLKQDGNNSDIHVEVSSGPLYGFVASIHQHISLSGKNKIKGNPYNYKGQPFVEFVSSDSKLSLEKLSFITTSRDKDTFNVFKCYDEELNDHLEIFDSLNERSNISVKGDDSILGKLNFSVYHTLISMPYWDGIHGVGAKGLTGEGYHQFVWWDSEIYQMPFFLYTNPNTAKNTLIYRYKMLEQSKKNAKENGYKGARFAFCSSVTGEEKVWSFAVHPFMQDHIVSDVIYGLLQYFFATDDKDFMEEMGNEILCECVRYWLSRTTKTSRGYEIFHVTGPDEHHWDVNNDAYTNYMVKYGLKTVLSLLNDRTISFAKFGFENAEIKDLKEQANNLFICESKNGYIPQFDGYFDLSMKMEDSSGAGTGPQMKYNGSYLKSQIIKQPDVLLLYSYTDILDDHSNLTRNLDHYEHMCECSSSLSYAPHAICSALDNRMNSFIDYLNKTISIDLENMHGGLDQGVHSGCEAGGYLSILFGLFGFRNKLGNLSLNPKYIPYYDEVSVPFIFKGRKFKAKLVGLSFEIKLIEGAPIDLEICGNKYLLKNILKIEL